MVEDPDATGLGESLHAAHDLTEETKKGTKSRLLGLGGSSFQIRGNDNRLGTRSVSGGHSLINIGKGSTEIQKQEGAQGSGGAYWKNPYYEKILERFNKLDLDVRMKIVGSNVFKNRRIVAPKQGSSQSKGNGVTNDLKLPRLKPGATGGGYQQPPLFFGEK